MQTIPYLFKANLNLKKKKKSIDKWEEWVYSIIIKGKEDKQNESFICSK